MMDFFFHRHFRHHRKKQKHTSVRQPGAAVQASKARRRSSVGLPSVALTQSRRSSNNGLPPIGTDACRRPSIGLLVASGQRFGETMGETERDMKREDRGNIKRGRRGFQQKLYHDCTSGSFSSVQHPSRVSSIEPHLLGSSLLLASLVQMGQKKEDEENGNRELQVSSCSCSDSDGADESEEELETEIKEVKNEDSKPQFQLSQMTTTRKIRARPLLRPPRCLRRNSSHLLPAESVLENSETTYGVYGRYNRRSSSDLQWASDKPIQAFSTNPCPGQLTPADLRSVSETAGETDTTFSGLEMRKKLASSSEANEDTIYYDPFVDTWDDFLSYVTYQHTLMNQVTQHDQKW